VIDRKQVQLLRRLSDAEKAKLGISGGGFSPGGTPDGTKFLRDDVTWQAPPGAGGGDSITIAGVALVDANFNATNPAAPAGALNAVFAKDAASPAQVAASILTDNTSLEINASAIRRAALAGDVTASAGANATTIKNDVALAGNPTTTTQLAADNSTRIATTAYVTSKVSGTNTGDVTLGGTPTYITIAGQVITRGNVDLTNSVTGDLPFANLVPATIQSRLVGRGSAAGAGDFEEITPSTGLTMTGTVLTTTIDPTLTEQNTNKNAASGYAGLSGGLLSTTQMGNAGTPSATTFLRGDQTWQVPTAPTGTGFYHTTVGVMDAAAVTDATLKTTVNTAPLFAAGTASANTAPRLTSGTLNTAADPGALEYDGSVFYTSNHATLPGRSLSANTTVFMLADADQGTVGTTIADFFTSTSSYPTNTNGRYIFDFHLWFLKTTAGTATFTLTNTQTYTNCNIRALSGPIAGLATTGTAAMIGIDKSTTAATALPASGILANAAEHYFHIQAIVACGTAGNIRLRITQSAGTVTARRGCYYTVRQLGAANTGAFVA